MGQKVHPYGFRLGINKGWLSKWYAEKDYAARLHEDLMIRKVIKEKLSRAGISRIEIERFTQRIRINIYTARPGIIIGRKGTEVELLKKFLVGLLDKQIFINIKEIKNADLDSQLVAEAIGFQLQRRISFRRAMKKAQQATMQAGALGIKICISGRLGGAEMSRTEWSREGRIPLHTLRANVDYGFHTAVTTYGSIGVKVWIFKGEVLGFSSEETAEDAAVGGV